MPHSSVSAAGIAGTIHLFSFSEYVAKGDFTSALKLVSKLHNESCDIDSLCTELTLHFRNLMVAKTVKECDGLIVCSKDELEIDFEDIQTIGAYVILNKEIPKEADAEEEAEKAETVKVEIDDE